MAAQQASGIATSKSLAGPVTASSGPSSALDARAPVMTFTGGSSSLAQEFLHNDLTVGNAAKTDKSPRRHEYKEHRRQSHISAEQKRRGNIKLGFEHLHQLLPSINSLPLNKVSKATLLHRGDINSFLVKYVVSRLVTCARCRERGPLAEGADRYGSRTAETSQGDRQFE
eukprot:m.25861 g.25861  ORF g.25861 m.25861 type:complete len:170 (+) comp28989_c1_seq3:1376-1885(+)